MASPKRRDSVRETSEEERPAMAPEPEPEPLPSKSLPQETPEPAKVPTEEPVTVTAAPAAYTGLVCANCGSHSVGIAGGMRRCNQCGHSWE
jgi:hypothetical protein